MDGIAFVRCNCVVSLLSYYPVAMLDKLKSRVTTFLVELFTLIVTFLLS